MTRKPTRNRLERAIERLESGEDGEVAGRTAPKDVKAYIGLKPADVCPLPEDAREMVEQNMLAFEDADDAAETFDLPDASRELGFDMEAILDQPADAEGE